MRFAAMALVATGLSLSTSVRAEDRAPTAFGDVCRAGQAAPAEARATVDFIMKDILSSTSCDDAEHKLRDTRLLDLSSAQLTSLEPLRGLPVEVLDLRKNRIGDLAPLRAMPKLRSVFGEDCCTEAADGSLLEELTPARKWISQFDRYETRVDAKTVRSLTVHCGDGVADLRQLQRFPNVEVLELVWCKLGHLEAIKSLRRLRHLFASTPAGSDLRGLEGSETLVSMTLVVGGGRTLPRFATFPRLRRLELVDGSPEGRQDLAALDGAIRLRSLVLPYVEGAQLARLRGMSELRELTANVAGPVDTSAIATLRSLRQLELDASYVDEGASVDAAELSAARSLNVLTMRGVAVRNPEKLAGLVHLRELTLKGASLSSIDWIASMVGLQKAWLAGNAFLTSEPLAKLFQLHSVDVAETGVKAIAPLKGLRYLRYLDAGNKQARDEDDFKAARPDVTLAYYQSWN